MGRVLVTKSEFFQRTSCSTTVVIQKSYQVKPKTDKNKLHSKDFPKFLLGCPLGTSWSLYRYKEKKWADR